MYAMNKLAKIYLEEKNIEMLPKALEYLKKAATVGKRHGNVCIGKRIQ